jgi:hypothetical protein
MERLNNRNIVKADMPFFMTLFAYSVLRQLPRQ